MEVSPFLVLSIISGLICTMINPKWIQLVCLMGLYLPFGFMGMYKSQVYLVDNMFYMSELSSSLSFLSISLIILVIISSSENSSSNYMYLVVLMSTMLLFCFNTWSLLAFYILFESCMIPILLMIIGWGYQPERLLAGSYMVLYTVIMSMPFLMMIFGIYDTFSTFNMYELGLFFNMVNPVLLVGMLAFLVKLPMFGIHLWLPKAHVEAPLGGSMILAALLLKLGGYGLVMFTNMIYMPNTTLSYVFIIVLSMWGGCLASFICMSQTDIKAFIAYSSIVHMSVVVIGVMSGSTWGYMSIIIIMLAHGWVSSALFLLAYISYKITGSRSFSYSKGLLMMYPTLGLGWFIFAIFNMGFPPTINFLGELFMVPVIFSYSVIVFLFFGIVLLMSVLYNMYMYCMINHGMVSSYMLPSSGVNSRMMLSLVGHGLPMLFIFNLNLFIL